MLPLEVVRRLFRATPWVVSRPPAVSYSEQVMGIDRRRLEAAALALVLFSTGAAALLPAVADKAAGCGCPVPCVKCCCGPDDQGDAEFCVLRDGGGSAPRSEMPPTLRPRITEAVLAAPVRQPHPVLEGRLQGPELLLPTSLVLPPEVPPPRAAG